MQFQILQYLPAGSTLICRDVSWDDYETLLAEIGDDSNARISYDNGKLEIMSPSRKHELYKGLISRLVDVLTEELDLEYVSFGAMTWRRKKKAKGTEADECFYIQNFARVADKDEINLETDPPPDLVIEVDIYHDSASKFSIYAALGVPEIWQHDGNEIRFYCLVENEYQEISHSLCFPFLSAPIMTQFLTPEEGKGMNAAKRAFRAWVQQHKPTAS
jgi:Uma2 family endonuclease